MGRRVTLDPVDRQVLRYLTLQEQLVEGHAAQPGEPFKRPRRGSCKACGGRKSRKITSARRVEGWVCAHCGEHWPSITRVEAMSRAHRKRSGDEALFEYAVLGRAIAALRIWERAVLVSYVHLGTLLAAWQRKRKHDQAPKRYSSEPWDSACEAIPRLPRRERRVLEACVALIAAGEHVDARRLRVLARAMRAAHPRTTEDWTEERVRSELTSARRSLEAALANRPRPRREPRDAGSRSPSIGMTG